MEESVDTNAEDLKHSKAWRESSILATLLFALFLLLLLEIWISRRVGDEIEVQRSAERRFEYRLNINDATAIELMHLPEIGPTLAERIVQERHERGPFVDVEDLQRIPGIGPKTLEAIKPYLYRPEPRSDDVLRDD